MVIWSAREGEIVQPRTGKQLKPWLPLKGPIDVPAEAGPAAALAAWLTAPDNPFFARAGVNRLWSQLLGRGIVEPVDDFRDSNPAVERGPCWTPWPAISPSMASISTTRFARSPAAAPTN